MGYNGKAFTPNEIAEIVRVPRHRVMYWLRSNYGWRQPTDDEYYQRWRLNREQAEAVLGHFIYEGIAEMDYEIVWQRRP